MAKQTRTRGVSEEIQRLEQRVSQAPDDAEAWSNLGMLCLVDEQYRRARECFEQLVQLRPGAESLAMLGGALLAEDRPADAVAPLEKAREMDPDNPEIASSLGAAYFRDGQAGRAEPLLQEATKKNPKNDEAHLILAKMAAGKRDFEKAIELCIHILKHDPADALSPLFLMGDCFLALGSLEHAEKAYAGALDIEPRNPTGLAGLANIHLLMGNTEQAESEFKRALEMDPNNADAHVGLGSLWLFREDPAQARTHYQAALDADPAKVKGAAPLAMVLLGEGDAAGARQLAETALASSPDDINCLLVGAQACELQGDFARQADLAEKAALVAPDNHLGHLLAARAEISLGRDLEKARQHLRLAAQNAPSEEVAAQIGKLAAALDASPSGGQTSA